MSNFVAYTKNGDGSINVLAGSNSKDILARILPAGTSYNVHEGGYVEAAGKCWLSADDEGYQKAKSEAEKAGKLAALDAEYETNKAELLKYYTDALLNGDTEQQASIKEDMDALTAQYDADYAEIEGGE